MQTIAPQLAHYSVTAGVCASRCWFSRNIYEICSLKVGDLIKLIRLIIVEVFFFLGGWVGGGAKIVGFIFKSRKKEG